MSKKLVYVSGPYRDPRGTAFVEDNIRAAEAISRELWTMGFAVICPHTNTKHMDGIIDSEEFIAGDLVMVERCDAIVMIDGWRRSAGAKQELWHAITGELFIQPYFWESWQDRQRLRWLASGIPVPVIQLKSRA